MHTGQSEPSQGKLSSSTVILELDIKVEVSGVEEKQGAHTDDAFLGFNLVMERRHTDRIISGLQSSLNEAGSLSQSEANRRVGLKRAVALMKANGQMQFFLLHRRTILIICSLNISKHREFIYVFICILHYQLFFRHHQSFFNPLQLAQRSGLRMSYIERLL